MIRKLYSGMAAMMMALMPLGAQALTPDEVASAILESSPAAEVTRKATEAAEASAGQLATLPDPEIEGEYLVARGDGANRWGGGISWGLEWPGVYAARRGESAERAKAAQMSGKAEHIARLGEIKKLLLEYILQQKQMETLKAVSNATDSIMMLAGQAMKAGEITKLDMNKLNLEKASIAAGIAEIEEAREGTVTSLSALYGRDCSELLGLMTCEFPTLELPSDLVAEEAAGRSAVVMAAEAEARAAKRAGKVATAESLPGISLGYRHAFEDNTHFNGASLGISIPLFSAGKKRKAAKAEAMAAVAQAEAVRAETESALRGNLKRLSTMKKRIEEIEPILTDGNNLSLLQKAYKGGLLTVIDYLNERNYFTNAQLDLLSLKYAGSVALIEINTLTRTEAM